MHGVSSRAITRPIVPPTRRATLCARLPRHFVWILHAEVSMTTMHVPYIIERSPRGERSYDIFSRLLMDRIVFLGTPVNDDVANIIIAQMLFLEADNPDRDIFLYINSPGGSVSAGLAIYDTMQYMKSPVHTICMGLAAS